MSTITIRFNYLEDSIDKAHKARQEIYDYADEIKKRITRPMAALSGDDSSGYVSTAANLAKQKIKELEKKATYFSSYEKSLNRFISTARTEDKTVSDRIETIAGIYIGERSFWEKVGDWIYNTFCVDLVNKWEPLRTFVDYVKDKINILGNYIEKAYNWFKYGGGKYILNIIMTGVKLGLAIVAFAGAIMSIPATGGLPLVLAIIYAGSTGISAGIMVFNAESSFKGNAKALSLYNDGKIGAARYYGNIDSKSEEWNRTDMGDQAENDRYASMGNIIDTTDTVAGVLSTATGGIIKYASVKDFRYADPTRYVKEYDFSLHNIGRNVAYDMGFYATKMEIRSGLTFFDFLGKSFNTGKDIFKRGNKLGTGIVDLFLS